MQLEPEVALNSAQLRKLQGYYKKATEDIIKSLTGASDFTQARKEAVLQQIDKILQELDGKTSGVIEQEVQEIYQKYSLQTAKAVASDGLPIDTAFTQIDRQAIEALAQGTMESYREAYSGVKRAAMRMLNDATREQLTMTLAEGRITGEARKAIADKIAGQLKDGLVSLIDKGGRQWTPEAYSNMLVRTMLVKSANDGIVNRLAGNGDDLVQVSNHGVTCDLCSPWESEVLSLSGRHPDYKSKAQAEDAGLFHPNCKHRLLPYHEPLAAISTVWNPDTQRYIQL